MKTRLDVLMVERGLAESREKAKAIIMSGNVFVDGQREDKAGASFPEKAVIEVKGSPLKYVSRGGLKLEKAMSHFDVELHDKVCMDVGSSTGGFTDCMLQNGAKKVFAVDVGNGRHQQRPQGLIGKLQKIRPICIFSCIIVGKFQKILSVAGSLKIRHQFAKIILDRCLTHSIGSPSLVDLKFTERKCICRSHQGASRPSGSSGKCSDFSALSGQ